MSSDVSETYCCLSDFVRCREFYRSHTLREDPLEFAGFVSFWCIALGILIVFGAILVPRSYTFDITRPAREMEATERFYSDLGFGLDVCSIIGMGFVTLGGLIMANATLYVLYRDSAPDDDDPAPLRLVPRGGGATGQEDAPLQAAAAARSYGSGTYQKTVKAPSAPIRHDLN